MQQLLESMVRFSAAMTLFGLQQLQNAIDLATDSRAARKKASESLDAVTDALTAQLDDKKRPAVESISNLADQTYDAFDIPAFNSHKVVDNVTEAVRKTTDAVADAIRKTSPASRKTECDEPVQAATILVAES